MRNDARPIGENSPPSPTGPSDRERAGRGTGDRPARGHDDADDRDARESVTHDRQSHLVHPDTERERDDEID